MPDALQTLRDNLPPHVEIAYFDAEMLELGGQKVRFTIVMPDPAVWELEVWDNSDEVIFTGDWDKIYVWLKAHGKLEVPVSDPG